MAAVFHLLHNVAAAVSTLLLIAVIFLKQKKNTPRWSEDILAWHSAFSASERRRSRLLVVRYEDLLQDTRYSRWLRKLATLARTNGAEQVGAVEDAGVPGSRRRRLPSRDGLRDEKQAGLPGWQSKKREREREPKQG